MPDGIIPLHPVANVDTTYFVPSLLYAIDEPFLSCHLMEWFEEQYVQELGPNYNYLMNPMLTPDEVFKADGKVKYPPTRMTFCGFDQLRD